MKQNIILLILIFLQLNAMAQTLSNTQVDGFQEKWQRSRDYTLAVVREMPFEKYTHKVAEDVMSFQEELAHIITNLEKLQYYITEQKQCKISGYGARIKKSRSMDEIISLSHKSFDYISSLWQDLSEEEKNAKVENFFKEDVYMEKEDIFYLMRNHVTHHRGRLTLQMRIAGVKPPRYVGW